MRIEERHDFDDYASVMWPRLVRAALLLGCSPPDAQDLVQTVLTRCLLKWRRVGSADDRDAYVHRMLVNTHISNRRRLWHREQPTPEPIADPPPSDDPFTTVVDRSAVLESLMRLPNDQRVAVVLRFYLDLSETQMADLLSVRPGTVKSRLSRALRALSLDPSITHFQDTQ